MTLSWTSILWVTLVIGVLGVFAGWPRAGGLAYLGAVLFAPVAMIGGVTLRIETALTPLMLGWLVFNGTYRWRAALVPFCGWVVWLTVVSLCSEGDVSVVGLYGNARFVAVGLVFGSIPWTHRDLVRAQYWFALSAIPIGLLSVGQVLNVPGARALTEAAYTYSSQVVFGMQMDGEIQGLLFRGVGVFGNVSPAATYYLAAMGVALVLLCDGARTQTTASRSAVMLSLAAAMAGGAATLSATFIGGFVPAIAVAVLVAPRGGRVRALALAGLFGLLGFGLAWFLTATSDEIAAQVDYQWNRIAQGDLLEDRYSGQEGVMAEAIEAIWERPVAGCGVKITETFHSDSMYVCLMFMSGIGGMLLFLAGFRALALAALGSGTGGRLALFWIILVLLTGIGSGGMFILRFGDWWWATQGMLAAAAGPLRDRCRREAPVLALPSAIGSSTAKARFDPAVQATLRIERSHAPVARRAVPGDRTPFGRSVS